MFRIEEPLYRPRDFFKEETLTAGGWKKINFGFRTLGLIVKNLKGPGVLLFSFADSDWDNKLSGKLYSGDNVTFDQRFESFIYIKADGGQVKYQIYAW